MVRGGMADVLDLAALYEWGQWVKSSMGLLVLKRRIPSCGKSCLKTLLVRTKGYLFYLHQPLSQSSDLIHCPENSLRKIVRCVRATHIWSSDFAINVLVMPEQRQDRKVTDPSEITS